MRDFTIQIVTGEHTTIRQAEHMINEEAARFAHKEGVIILARVSIHRAPFALNPGSTKHTATYRAGNKPQLANPTYTPQPGTASAVIPRGTQTPQGR